MRVITLPSGRRVSLGEYVRSWRAVKAIVAVDPEREVAHWQWFPVPAREVLADIRAGMDERINARVPYVDRR